MTDRTHFTNVERVADALLYEGYVLYPYRPDALKNRQRWTFGGLLPEGFAVTGEGTSSATARCLVRGPASARLGTRVRFLHLVERTRPEDTRAWQEAVRRDVDAPPLDLAELTERPRALAFSFGPEDSTEDRIRRRSEAVAGTLELSAERLGPDLHRVTARVLNRTSLARGLERSLAELRSLASLHVLLHVEEPASASFVSLQGPPDELKEAARACQGEGLWPVLVGERGSCDTLLASPIIVEDHPTIAPESPGDFFDATEIDEMLTLRILTLTDAEKAAMREGDPRARALLERTEGLGLEGLLALHGRLRELSAPASGGLGPGSRVRLAPRGRADAFDMALAGRAATVRSIEHTLEGEAYVAVTVDDDPGEDLGIARFVGHRFFFRLDEVEPLDGKAA